MKGRLAIDDKYVMSFTYFVFVLAINPSDWFIFLSRDH